MTDRQFLTQWGFAAQAEDSLRRSVVRLLKKTKGKLTAYERSYLQALLGHLATKDAAQSR